MASITSTETLNQLFRLPLTSDEPLAPKLSPGHTADSAESLVETLRENHRRFHIFFNDKGFHNHATHHLYAIYAMGASRKIIEAAFESNAAYQRASIEPPGDITDSNWTEYFGDERYYQAYVTFFAGKAFKDGLASAVEKYVFAPSSNWVEGLDDKKQPQMLNRFLSGVLHPYIHVGYALEFDSVGMLAEGLAMACVTRNSDFDAILPRSFFATEKTSTLSSLVSALSLSNKPSSGSHTFDIIARMLLDPDLAPGAACKAPTGRHSVSDGEEDDVLPMQGVLQKRGDLILKYASEWTIDAQNKEEVNAKVEELFVLVTVLYGVAGLQPGKDFKADFFLVHLVTSSLFLPSFTSHLQPSSLSMLLRSYFASALTVWIARGRPAPQIASFYSRTKPQFSAPGPAPTPGPDALAPESAVSPNPWLQVTQSALVHPDEHLPKAIRALAHYAYVLGAKPAGSWAEKGCKLDGAELLDGSLFIRAASLTMDRLGWVREGKKKGGWDYSGFWM